ncbi:alkaline-phosphatase-like, core domain containing protein [Nitzschia inconspicua]|uniref:Alkaline-phosphatase-like, core domain containing protein n=1 Tax=Nitzschia inconspicua TaxID=303405 RepID=A0A9K3PMF0_9STRA|nr:alkaline-phosphatase-like, core domain containing protein [Nitzschia inconspicua]
MQFLYLLILLSSASSSVSNIHDVRKPNFILFFVDDLGYGDVGFTGHPTTHTPNLDRLAWSGKILTSWYSGCNVCTGSRAAIMTGRQHARTGLPGVIPSDCPYGLNMEEITIAEHLKKHAGYSTAIVGKWHLGQRKVYLPGNRGFDFYLGIPFSDDMGIGRQSQCHGRTTEERKPDEVDSKRDAEDVWQSRKMYEELGLLESRPVTSTETGATLPDPGKKWLPLVYQAKNVTKILEQPVDLTTLSSKYSNFATTFIEDHKDSPFFLYVPFSHVHTTAPGSTPEMQYAGCAFQNTTGRGAFGDALAETDWMVGNIMNRLRDLGLEEDTLILFTSDNGPWMIRGLSGGSEGLFTGRYSLHDGYDNTGKGSNWEGGIREPAFAYWKGSIAPFSRSSEVVSSLDVFPTLSKLAGISLPTDRPYDGKDMSEVLMTENGQSKHNFLFFYGTCNDEPYWSVTGVRHGKYKAHWCTAPGIGQFNASTTKRYDPPMLFDVEKDPSESEPISVNAMPPKEEDFAAMERILAAYTNERATFRFGKISQEPDEEGEGPGQYALCCDRSQQCYCPKNHNSGILNLGTRAHHDQYHEAMGLAEPLPATKYQNILQHRG